MKRVVIVEDSALVRGRLSEQLAGLPGVELAGYAETPAEAIRLIVNVAPDAVILDLSLRGGSGLTVLERVKQMDGAPRVIVLTNHSQDEYRRHCLRLGADAFLDKSVEFMRVGEILRQLLAEPGTPATTAAPSAEQRRYEALVAHAWDAVALISREGRILYGSPATLRVLGYSDEELVGRSAFDLIHPDSMPHVIEQLTAVLATPGASVPVQARLRRKDGAWRVCEGVMTNMLEEPGVGAIVNNYRDVTEWRQLEEQLRHSQRMEGVGHLAGGVAHDFNNLLTTITGYGELVLRELPPDHPARSDLQEVLKAAERAAGLTRQLLAFNRDQAVVPRVLDPNVIVAGAEPMLRRLLGKGIELVTTLDPEAGLIRADLGQMEQVLLNLAVNARDAMPSGGRLTITTSNAILDDAHGGAQPGRYVRVTISDTGVGMSRDVLAHLFEPFVTTREPGKGTGLGLSAVHSIIQQSGGYIVVDSEPGHGATFRLHLPRADDLPEAPQEPSRG